MKETKIIVATESIGLETTNLVIVLEVEQGVDIEKAIMEACKEYCQTKEGQQTYENNCNSFNWGDFDTYVPNEICEKYGIKKIQTNVAQEFDFNQQLIDEDELVIQEERE